MNKTVAPGIQSQGLNIKFSDCADGWITLIICAGDKSIQISLSEVFDPAPDLLAWLEAVSTGVEKCSFRIDEEGVLTQLIAAQRHDDQVKFRVERLDVSAQHVELVLKRRELVSTIYQAFLAFSASPDYKPEAWQSRCLKDAVVELAGLPTDQWIESCLRMSRRELQMALWRLDQDISADDATARQSNCFATAEEVLVLTGQAPVTGELLVYWPLIEWDQLQGDDAKRQVLQNLMEENIGWYMGWPWRNMRSKLLDAWLASDEVPAKALWRKWVVDVH